MTPASTYPAVQRLTQAEVRQRLRDLDTAEVFVDAEIQRLIQKKLQIADERERLAAQRRD